MKATRILGALCATLLASSFGTLAACGGEQPEKAEVQTAKTVSAASVSISLIDEHGTKVGEGSGVMIAPRLVLTSAHLISGKAKWVVKSADGKQSAEGSRGLTYDWRVYNSNLAHPRLHDVGVIHLDSSIKLDTYPRVVSEKAAEGSQATRIRGTGAGFDQIGTTLGRVRTSPNTYLVDVGGETLDTGGAVFDARGIVGVVQGRGMTTGKLYIARTDRLAQWLSPKVICAGGSLSARTFASPAPKEEICEDAGAGSGNNPNGSNAGSGQPGASGPDGTPGSDGTPTDSCAGDNDGLCSGVGCAQDGSATLVNPNGAAGPDGSGNPGASNGGDGTGGENGSGANGGGAGGNNGSAGTDGNSGPGAGAGGDGNGGENGSGANGGGAGANANNGSAGTDGNSGPGSNGAGAGNNGGQERASSSPSGGAGGSSRAAPEEGEGCQGPNDSPELCPAEPDGCVGPTCGGGQPDNSIDYGGCACGASSSGGDGIYLR